MPELPEVEVTRLGFADRIAGATIDTVRLGKPLRWPLGIDTLLLHGRRITQVRRRGKYLLLDLDEGILLMHLGMSGSLSFVPGWPSLLGPAGPHDHCDIVTTQGGLRLHDPRRFGAVVYSQGQATLPASKLLGNLGAEPLEPLFTVQALHAGFKNRQTPVKQVLLAGAIVVGVGNIYASEALFLAHIRPTTAAAKLSRPRVAKLHAAICQVLQRAVDAGGSSLRNFSHADGTPGHFQLSAMVYGRAGKPCRVCAAPIKVIRQGARSSFFCPICQKH